MARFLLLSLLLASLWSAGEGEQERGIVAGELRTQHWNADKDIAYNGTLGPFMENVTDWEIFPQSDLGSLYYNSSRRVLGSFQVCALCTCCGGRIRFCIPTACCYTITCGSPNRPFGLCSFTPMSCSCLGCRF